MMKKTIIKKSASAQEALLRHAGSSQKAVNQLRQFIAIHCQKSKNTCEQLPISVNFCSMSRPHKKSCTVHTTNGHFVIL